MSFEITTSSSTRSCTACHCDIPIDRQYIELNYDDWGERFCLDCAPTELAKYIRSELEDISTPLIELPFDLQLRLLEELKTDPQVSAFIEALTLSNKANDR